MEFLCHSGKGGQAPFQTTEKEPVPVFLTIRRVKGFMQDRLDHAPPRAQRTPRRALCELIDEDSPDLFQFCYLFLYGGRAGAETRPYAVDSLPASLTKHVVSATARPFSPHGGRPYAVDSLPAYPQCWLFSCNGTGGEVPNGDLTPYIF